jgi:hypothetical protein
MRASPGYSDETLLVIGTTTTRAPYALHESFEITSAGRDYRRGLVPLLVPLTLIRHHVRRLRVAYLAEQT